MRLINEPTAAAIAFNIATDEQKYIAVLDVGGGTYDITILSLKDNVYDVLATDGDTKLGGLDMDKVFISFIINKIETMYRVSLNRNDQTIWERIRSACEIAKIELSTVLQTNIIIPYLLMDQNN